MFGEVAKVDVQRSFVETAFDEKPFSRVVCKAGLGLLLLRPQCCVHNSCSSVYVPSSGQGSGQAVRGKCYLQGNMQSPLPRVALVSALVPVFRVVPDPWEKV